MREFRQRYIVPGMVLIPTAFFWYSRAAKRDMHWAKKDAWRCFVRAWRLSSHSRHAGVHSGRVLTRYVDKCYEPIECTFPVGV